MKDENIYSTSSFIQLLGKHYGLDLISLSALLEISFTDVYNMKMGRKELGYDNYQELKLLYPELPKADFDGTYKNPNWVEGVF